MIYDKITIGFVIIGVIVFILLIRRIKAILFDIFGGHIDKTEFGGLVFLILFTYMIIMEGRREHEWSIYNELYIFFTAGAAMTGLGLKSVLSTIKDIKGGTSTEIKTVHKETKHESESPK